MPARAVSFRLPILAAVLIVACLYAFSPNFRFASGPEAPPYGGDFLQEWLGGWIVIHGDTTRFYDAQYAYGLQHDPQLVGFAWNDDEYLPVVYPPFYYVVISPLSLVPLHTAAWIWAGLMTAALAAALWLLFDRLYDGVPRPSNVWVPWAIPATVLFAPVLESLGSSQKGTLCLLLLTATFVLWDRRRAFAAGAVFGLLAFKPQLVLVIVVAALWKRQWRFLAGAAATGAVLLALSLAVGLDACRQYVRFALGAGEYMDIAGYDLYKSHSVWGFAKLLCGEQHAPLATALGAVLGAFVVLQLMTCLRGRWIPGSARFRWQFAVLVVATVLLSPHLFTYDLTVLLLPMAVVLAQRNVGPIAQSPSLARRARVGSSLALRVGVDSSLARRVGVGSSLARRVGVDSSLALRVGVPLLWVTAVLYVAPHVSTRLAASTGWQITVPLMLIYVGALTCAARNQAPRRTCNRIDCAGVRREHSLA